MKGPTNESVGDKFQTDLLQRARDLTLQVIEETVAQVAPGMSEANIRSLLDATQKRLGAEKPWHPPQIRIGENTLLPFNQKGKENLMLQANDIFFLDIGPVFQGHEGDVGRPYAVGNDAEMVKCCRDAETLWREVRDHWASTQATGAALYAFAESRARAQGWVLTVEKANGHRIADFPHAAGVRGSIEGFPARPASNRWILEIQIRHPERPFGAFYEDLLN